MASEPQIPTPTLGDKLLIVPLLVKVIGSALFRCVSLPFISKKANKPFKDVAFAALRSNLAGVNAAQEQWMNAAQSTDQTYLDIAKKAKFQPDTDVLDSGLKVHWLGPKSAEKIILYFHGGGYVLSCSPGHITWLYELQQDLSKKTNVAVVLVSYTLAPKGQYPLNIKQAAESLQFLLTKQGKKASNIVIAGDSAGGNMTVGLISHLLHPHPDVPKIELSEPLATAVLISPWVKFSTTDDSWKRNATSDMIPPIAAARWSSLFKGSKPSDEYNEPILADAKWFSGLDKIVKDILVWGGDSEVLIDSIQDFTKTLKAAHPKVDLVVEKGAAHEDFLMDKLLGYSGKAEGTQLIESWIAERI
ncbi:Esterase [Pseudocercospora fuligena]|uniref:Esterase n=1 Tax=Pseudocercospora fuligena TaxID=685502 RepID=A0A8H6VEC3_9PEZI|nr:Esterase [Pseudocercospora fuligena]